MSPLSAEERAVLHRVARAAIRHQLGLGPPPPPPAWGPLGERRGAFVELRVGGEPRGFLGRLAARQGLGAAVAELAAAAARHDPRFPPLDAAALPALQVRIWALGRLRPLTGPDDIAPERDGVAVRRGWHHGLLLPGEATARGWDARTLLQRTCLAAGLPPGAWQEPDATVELFSAEDLGAEGA